MRVYVHLLKNEWTDTKDFKFAHVLTRSVQVDTKDPLLSNFMPIDLLNVTADHNRQGQAVHRQYRQITLSIVEFASGKGHA